MFDGDPNVNLDTRDEEDVIYIGLRQNQSGGAALLSRFRIELELVGQAKSFVREAGSTTTNKKKKRRRCAFSRRLRALDFVDSET